MPFLNIDDNFADHPKIFGLSDAAFRLHTSGLCDSARHLTDGYIAEERVASLVKRFRRRALEELVDDGLWLPAPGGYRIHDYLHWNASRAEVEARREANRKRVERWREARER